MAADSITRRDHGWDHRDPRGVMRFLTSGSLFTWGRAQDHERIVIKIAMHERSCLQLLTSSKSAYLDHRSYDVNEALDDEVLVSGANLA